MAKKIVTPYVTKRKLLKVFCDNNIVITKLLKRALRQAYTSHHEQKRDDNGPYLQQHIYPVVIDLIDYWKNNISKVDIPEQLIIGAILHDTLEDDIEIGKRKFLKIFGTEIYDIVKPLTKPRHNRTLSEKDLMELNHDLWDGVKMHGGFTLLIKLADRTNNIEGFLSFKDLDFPKFYRYIQEVEEDYLPYVKEHNDYYYKRLSTVVNELKKRNKKNSI
jgi:(p)ppGpp synthase/HD superfamily hydrolase